MEVSSAKNTLCHLIESLNSKDKSDAFPISDFKQCVEAISEEDRFSVFKAEFDLLSAFKTEIDKNWTILHRAARWGNIEVVKLVLGSVSTKRGVELLDVRNGGGDTPLHSAARSDHPECIEYIMKWMQSDVDSLIKLLNVRGACGMTPLHRACWLGTADACKHIRDGVPSDCWMQLLKHKANDQRIALHHASNRQDPDAAERIKIILGKLPTALQLELLSAEDNWESTPLHLACNEYSPSTSVECILDIAPPDKHFQLLQKQNRMGATPLHIACVVDSGNTLKHILRVLPSHNRLKLLKTKDKNGDTPLHTACKQGRYLANAKHILDVLSPKSKHNLLNFVNNQKETPLHVACCKGKSAKLVKCLLENIPSDDRVDLLTKTDSQGFAVVQIAMQSSNTANAVLRELNSAGLKQLIKKHAGIDISKLSQQNVIRLFDEVSKETRYKLASKQNRNGNTILHRVSQKVAGVILSKLSPAHRRKILKIQNKSGKSALEFAESKGKYSLAEELKKYSQLTNKATGGKGNHLKSPQSFTPESQVLPSLPKLGDQVGSSDTPATKRSIASQATSSLECGVTSAKFARYDESVTPGEPGTSSFSTEQEIASETATSGRPIRFGRVTNVQEVVDLLSFVHKQMKEGKTVNGALKLAKKSRKTIDRFLNIYYLHAQNRKKLEKLESECKTKRKPGGLQELDKLAKKEINWEQLQKLFDDGFVADFTVR